MIPLPLSVDSLQAVEEYARDMQLRLRRTEEQLSAASDREVSMREQLGRQERALRNYREAEAERDCRRRIESMTVAPDANSDNNRNQRRSRSPAHGAVPVRTSPANNPRVDFASDAIA